MRYYIVPLFIIIFHAAAAQITLPSYQAVQYRGGGLPTVTTTAISSITIEAAASGGSISSDGSSSITAKGVCWNTSSGPTIALSTKTSDGTGTGSFSSSLSSLSPGVTYYVRAYATNINGTSYGNEVSFITTNLAIGNAYQGGKIVYILVSGDPGFNAAVTHGFIVANPYNAGPWQPASSDLLATSSALGAGATNTATIVAARGAGSYAASIAYDLEYNGYSDWYLPSLDELYKLYQNRVAVGFNPTSSFWSSTQNDATSAWYVNFSTGGKITRSTGSVWGFTYFRSF